MESKPVRNSLSFKGLIRESLKSWKTILLSVVVFTGLGVLWVLISQSRSEVIANVMITEDEGMSGAGSMAMELAANFSMGDMFGGSRSVDDELAVMKSHSVFVNTVKDMGLNEICFVKKGFLKKVQYFHDEPVKLSYPSSLPDTLGIPIRFKLHVDRQGKLDVTTYLGRKKYSEVEGLTMPAVVTNPFGSYTFERGTTFVEGEDVSETVTLLSYDAAAEMYSRLIEIFILNKKTDMISLSMKSTDPRYAREIINNLIENYNETGIEEKRTRDNRTAEFVSERLESLIGELAVSETDIENFKRENNLVDVETQAGLLLTNVNEHANLLLEAETEYEILGMIRNFIADPANRYSLLPPLMTDDGSLSILTGYNDLILKRLSIEGSGARNDNAQLRLLTEQIDAMRDNVIRSLDKKYEMMGVRIAEARKQVNKTNSIVNQIPTKERQFVAMKRQQVVKEQLYLYLLRQQEEVALSIANARPRGLIVDAAYISSEPVGLSSTMKLALMFLIGVIAGVGYVYVSDRMRRHVVSRADVEGATGLPVLGEVTASAEEGLVVSRDTTSVAGELFRIVRSNLQSLLGDDHKVVSVTSPTDGAGKTFVACNIAASLGLIGKRTVIVDANLREPRVAEILSAKGGAGLADYIDGKSADINAVIQRNAAGIAGLDAIAAGNVSGNAADLLASDRLKELVDALRGMYDYVIIDSPTIKSTTGDTRSLNRLTDATVCVFRSGKTLFTDIEYINSIAEVLTTPAVVVNGVESGRRS